MLVTSAGTTGIALPRVLGCGHSQTAHLPKTISVRAGDRRTDVDCVRSTIREVRGPVSTSKSHLQASDTEHVKKIKFLIDIKSFRPHYGPGVDSAFNPLNTELNPICQ